MLHLWGAVLNGIAVLTIGVKVHEHALFPFDDAILMNASPFCCECELFALRG